MASGTIAEHEVINAWIGKFRERLMATPRYWVQVAKTPMPRSVPCVMWADVERAIDAGFIDSNEQNGGTDGERHNRETSA